MTLTLLSGQAFALCEAHVGITGQVGSSNDTIYTCINSTLQFEDQSLLDGLLSVRTWDFGDGSNAVDGLLSSVAQYTYTQEGTYTMTLTVSSALCPTMVESRVVVVLGQPQFNVSATDASCFGFCDGQASVSINGDNAGFYHFIWNDPNIQQGPTAIDLCSGSYFAILFDDYGCTDISTNPVSVNQPGPFTVSINTIVPVNCNGNATGVVSLNTSGGSGPYTFDIGDGPQPNNSFTGLTGGNYSVVATNSGGCHDTVSFMIPEPSALVASVDGTTDATCNGTSTGSVTLSASGGVSPYTFDIGGGAVSTGGFTGLAAGSYTATIKDANNCETTVGFTIGEPAVLSASIDSNNDVDCNGNETGSATASASGGTAPYTYDIGAGPQASGEFTDLAAGDYFVTVKDANLCQTVIGFTINEPAVLSGSFDASFEADCHGNNTGAVEVSASGGSGPYDFELNSVVQVDGHFSNLFAGSYTVNITDDHGCQTSVPVSVSEPDELTGSVVSTSPVDCFGNQNGGAEVVAAGGVSPYTFDIGLGSQADGIFSGLDAGPYSVGITDDHGCNVMVPVTIIEPDQLVVSFNAGAEMNLCPSNGDTQLEASISGGVTPYNSTWTSSPDLNVTGVNTATLSPNAGSLDMDYVISVTDQNGCEASDTVAVNSTNSTLQGTISMGNFPCIDCEVFMYHYDAVNPGVWNAIDSVTTDAVGNYDFGQVNNFEPFVLMADPNDQFYPMSVETFYPAAYDWNDATVFNMCGNDYTKNIAVIEPMVFNGTNILSGTVWYSPNGKTQTEEDPIPLIDVVVEKTPPGQAQGRVTTDTLGQFEFAYVPSSDTTYTLFVNIPGLPVTNTYEILANSDGEHFSHLDFCVNMDWTEINTCEVDQELATDPIESDETGLLLYPNPSNGMFTIETGKFAETDSEIRIVDPSGREVFRKRYEETPYTINMVNVAEGYYLVQIMNASAADALGLTVMRQ